MEHAHEVVHQQEHAAPAPRHDTPDEPRPRVRRRGEAARATGAHAEAAAPAGSGFYEAVNAGLLVERATSGGGQALPSELRARFEQSLGVDLCDVRVHTGADASASARALDARAYATGRDIVFADGEYRPESPEGVHMLAHEVAHTVQQPARAPRVHDVSRAGDAGEREADAAAAAMIAGRRAPALARQPASAARIQRIGSDMAVGPAPEDHRTSADRSMTTGGVTNPELVIEGVRLGNLNSAHWRAEREVTQRIDVPGQPPSYGQFVVSRYHRDGRPAARAVDATGQPVIPRADDEGPLIRYIENHPTHARMLGLRVIHNADGLVTHLVTPSPSALRQIRAGLPDELRPDATVRSVNTRIDGPAFAQTLRVGAVPISMQTSGDQAPLYYHDWLQHLVGCISIGPNTLGYLHQMAHLIRDLYGVADRVSRTPVNSDPVRAAEDPHERYRDPRDPRRQDPQVAATRNAPLGDALRRMVGRVAGTGTMFERPTVRITELLAHRRGELDAQRAELAAQLELLWTRDPLLRELTHQEAPALSPQDRAIYDRAVVEMAAIRDRYRAELEGLYARHAGLIADDVGRMIDRIDRAESAPEYTATVFEHTLSLLDEEGMRRAAEQFAAEGRAPQALAELQRQRDTLRGSTSASQQHRADVGRYGSDVSGAAAATPGDRQQEQRVQVLDQLVARFDAALAGTSDTARAAFVARFQQIGVRAMTQVLERGRAQRAGVPAHARAPAHARGSAPAPAQPQPVVLEPHEEAQLIARYIGRVDAAFVWTNPELFEAVSRAVNLNQHPLRQRWIQQERARHQPPAESHALRNILIGAAIVAGVIGGVMVLAEAGAAIEAGATAIFTQTGSAIELRALVEGVRVVTALESVAEVEAASVVEVVVRAVAAP